MEVKLSHLDDPIGFVLKVLRRQVALLEVFQTNPRDRVASIYHENAGVIDECQRDVTVAWTQLRDTVIEVGHALDDPNGKLFARLNHAVVVCQKVCSLMDDFCGRYSIPTNDPILFSKIGSLLHP